MESVQKLVTLPAILHDHEQLPFAQAHRARAQDIEDVEVFAKVDHDLEFGHQGANVGDVGLSKPKDLLLKMCWQNVMQ